MTKFTHLHVHSHYSLLDGLSKIPELIDYVKELGMDAIALTDHGVLYGAVEFYKEAKKKDIKPIIGCETYIAYERMTQKRPNIDSKRYHLVLLAKNQKGYQNLVKLTTEAHLKGFYYKPRIDDELLAQYSEGLIGLSACIQGQIPRLIISSRIKEAEEKALKYQEIFGKDSFYLELQHHPNIKEQKIANQGLIAISKKYNIPLVATNDSHYLRPEDAKAQDILMLINTGADKNDPERLTMMADDFSLRSPGQMAKDFKDISQAIENTEKIKEMCNFEFSFGNTILPRFETPHGTPERYLEELCLKGIKKRYQDSPPSGLKERLEKELMLINEMGFCAYFLIVQDFVRWAKKNNIVVGPGRGSVGGSLAAYLLGITEIDPLKYGLLFGRFLNRGRISMPDIDLDFTDERRNEVIEYVREKYGKDKVAQIITFGTMAARAVVRDVGRAMGYTYTYCDRIAKMIPFGYSLEKTLSKVYNFKRLYEEDERAKILIDNARKLEGVARHGSTHACGVVISREPLEKIVPLQRSSQDDRTIVTQYDMYGVEALGLLKMDFLGLKNLTIIENSLSLIKKNQNQAINLHSLPLNNKKTFKLLQRAETTSVFQLESDGMKRCLKTLKPTEFNDIVVMVALYRPGPIELIPQYIRRKHGKEEIEYLHHRLKPILRSTYGIMIFQEQLMQLAQDLAGFSLSEADILRKAVGKKIKSLLIRQKDKFIKGMIENNIEENIAQRIWQWIMPFARYGFNKAHATAYALIAYQTAYLKANFPVEFMAAVFASEKTEVERTAFLIEECKSMGIKVLPPDINESEKDFTVAEKNKIKFGLEAIKNVGSAVVEIIIEERKKNGQFKSIYDFASRIEHKALNKKTMESLIKAGVFDKLGERNQLLENLPKLLSWARDKQKYRANGQRSLFQTTGITPKIKLRRVRPASKEERLSWEKELLGLYVTSHPLERFTELLKKSAFPIAGVVKNILKTKKRIRVAGIISKVKKIMTKNGKPMLFLTLEDQTDKVEVVVFPKIVEQNIKVLKEEKIVFVSGYINNRDGVPKLICEQIEEIVENHS